MTTTLTAPTPPPMLTIDEVAAYLQVPKKTLYNWRAAGGGPRAMKVGNTLRFRMSDIDAFTDLHSKDAA